MDFSRNIRDNGVQKVTNATARLALYPTDGDLVEQLDDNSLWAFHAPTQTWILIGGPGSSAPSFGIVQTPNGTSPTASVPTDTLNFTSSDNSITITGNALTDTVNFVLSFTPEFPLTFSTGLTRIVNTVTANISTGISGGQSIFGGTASGEGLTISSTVDATKGIITIDSRTLSTAAAALSSPSLWLQGAPVTSGGTATTTKPVLLLQASATTSNNWLTAGTFLGVNSSNSFSGSLIDLQKSATRMFQVTANANQSIPTMTFAPTPWSVSNGTYFGFLISTSDSGPINPITSKPFYIQSSNADVFSVNRVGGVVSTQGTITVSAPSFSSTQTWNNAAVDFTGFNVQITNTASGAESLLFRVGNFAFDKNGKFILIASTPSTSENTFDFNQWRSNTSISLSSRNGAGITMGGSAGTTRFDVGGGSVGIGNAAANQVAISTAPSGAAVLRSLWFSDGHQIHSTAPVATTQYGTMSIGSGTFAGAAGGFVGISGSGTSLAINEITGYAGSLIDAQVSGSSKFSVASSGATLIASTLGVSANITALGGTIRYSNANNTITGNGSNQMTFTVNNNNVVAGTSSNYVFAGTSTNQFTSGTVNVINVPMTFTPTSGTAEYNYLVLSGTVNQTGGASGITRGLYINPTITAAANFRALEVVSGISIFGGGINVPANISSTLNGVVIGGSSGNRTLVTPDANPAIINLGFTSTGLTFTTHTNYTGGIGFTFNALPNTTQDLFAIQKAGTAALTVTNAGDFSQAIGKKLIIPSGTNARQGIATLSSGTVTVSTTAVTANSQIYVVYNTPSGTLASGLSVPVGSISAGTSFVINSLTTAGIVNISDNSTVNWVILDTA